MKEITVEVLVGLPASGKSTYAKNKVKESDYTFTHLTSDGIREEFDYNISNSEVFNLMESRMFFCMTKGLSIIYDATNLNAKRRRSLVNKIKGFAKNHRDSMRVEINCRLFLQPMDILYERNEKRTGRACVPEYVIERMFKQFQIPMKWEGFNNIIVDSSSEGDELPIEDICIMKQDNPYHSYDLGEHLAVANNYAIVHQYSYCVVAAALYHDVGKLMVKEFDEQGVAHYYNHENTGAYMLALHFLKHNVLDNERYWYIVELVNYHMRPYVWQKSAKAVKRDTDLFGSDFIEDLLNVFYCDQYAH